MTKSRVSVVSMAAWIAAVGLCAAQQPAFKRTEVQRGDLSASGREGVQALAEFPPGAAAGKHTHPGEELGYVLEGNFRIEIDGRPAVMKKAGEAFFVPAGRTHNATNVGSGAARILATYIVEKGKPLATPVP
jgi:quercetin dioxygenase-like cupin family protein